MQSAHAREFAYFSFTTLVGLIAIPFQMAEVEVEEVKSDIHPVALIMGVTLVNAGLAYRSFNLWREERQIQQVQQDVEDVAKQPPSLLERFDNLSLEQKKALVVEGLADSDEIGKIHLRFICPITYDLISELGIIRVAYLGRETVEFYEKSFIEKHLANQVENKIFQLTSPLSTRPIIQNEDGSYIVENESYLIEDDFYADRHRKYISDLQAALDRIAPLEEENRPQQRMG